MWKRSCGAIAVAGSVALSMLGASQAWAWSSSSTARFDNGGTLTANIWVSSEFNMGSCNDFKSSAVSSIKPTWIKDAVDIHATGFNVALHGAGATFSGANGHATVTNNRGQTGAYLSGRVCAGLTAISVRYTATASALAYGNIRIASASV
ncbi:hypothetical protein [Acidipropionibacterium timonense]|uniref:hypothetical protein n=1 Tax=Acidipropionibacterium timonense TaxID=2161818 RepID=UPI001030C5F0|nr:hypothetical protein [Acidipropionibacterium timonense]